MFTHILVPLDGSRLAESALPAAAFIARRMDARVTLLHALEKDPPGEVHGQPHLQNAAEAAAYLAGAAKRAFGPDVRVGIHVHETPVENVARAIVDHAAELDYDLIVMCSHGRGKALHLVLGGIAQKTTSLGRIPALIVQPADSADSADWAEQGETPDFVCESVLLPIDDDPDHARARPLAADLAKACGATLRVVMAVPRFTDLSGTRAASSRFLPGAASRLLDIAVDEARETLQKELAILREAGVAATGHLMRGDPAQVIIAAARELDVDLVALATHGATGLSALLEGSVAHKVCSLCGLPILMVPAGTAGRGE